MAKNQKKVVVIRLLRASKEKLQEEIDRVARERVIEPPDVHAGNDPKEPRSAGMKCATCMWFVPNLGRCRRHNGYPVVFATDWCDDNELNEVAKMAA